MPDARGNGSAGFVLNCIDTRAGTANSYARHARAFRHDVSRSKVHRKSSRDANVSSTQDSDSVDREKVSFAYQYRRPNRNFWLALSSFESSEEQGIDGRRMVGLGMGRFLYPRPTAEVTGFVGVDAIEEWAAGTDTQQQSTELLTGLRWSVFRFGDPETSLSSGLTLFREVAGANRSRASADISLRRELVKDFFLDLSLYESYDSKPPGVNSDSTDYATLLGYKF